MGATRCPFATWKPISHNIRRGGRKTIRGFVPHVQVGLGSLHEFFDRPATKASTDFWCSKTGVLEQYVDLGDVSWAQGKGNPFFASCEFEGFPHEAMTPAQLDRGGQLVAWLQTDVSQWPLVVNHDPAEAGVTPHYVFGGGHTCPGPGPREGQFPDLILAALRHLDDHHEPSPQEDDDMPPAPATAQLADGNVISIVRGADRETYFYCPAPNVFSPLPGKWSTGPSVVATDARQIIVRGVGLDGGLYETRLTYDVPNAAWTDPVPLGGKAG